jgi:hypothetical protein
VDSQLKFLSEIHSALAADSDVLAALGTSQGVTADMRIFPFIATVDAPMPYLVYAVRDSSGVNEQGFKEGVLIVDVWDFSSTFANVHALRDAVTRLLEHTVFTDGDTSTVLGHIYSSRSEVIPTDAENVLRQELRFEARYRQLAEVADYV